MGASVSSSREKTDRVLLGALRGRRLDLPGGGDLYVHANAGAHTSRFTPRGSKTSIDLQVIGRSCLYDSGREFIVMRGPDGVVYGREATTGMHVLAVSVRDLLCKVGLSQRDLEVLKGTAYDKEYRSPSRTRPPRSQDSILGRSRGVSVDRRGHASAVPARAESADSRPAPRAAELVCESRSYCSSADYVRGAAGRRSSSTSSSASRIRFGPTTVFSGQNETTSVDRCGFTRMSFSRRSVSASPRDSRRGRRGVDVRHNDAGAGGLERRRVDYSPSTDPADVGSKHRRGSSDRGRAAARDACDADYANIDDERTPPPARDYEERAIDVPGVSSVPKPEGRRQEPPGRANTPAVSRRPNNARPKRHGAPKFPPILQGRDSDYSDDGTYEVQPVMF
uniref:Uncharacterized protein n=1 Tax=Anatid alphaherpesvirus 2 TaxID=3080522 RepID=A0AAU0K6H9_9ALPH